MNSTHLNKEILDLIAPVLKSEAYVLSAWVGGSAATGYEDSLSDLDIVVVSQKPDVVFQILRTELDKSFGIQNVWNVEESAWKGFHQNFFILKNTPDSYYVDAGVFTNLNSEDYEEHFNKDRHGSPVILFDKTGILEAASKKPKTVKLPEFDKSNWQARFEIMYRTFLKESLRNKYIDSFLFYQRLVLMLVQLLRRQQSPQKHDFGLRYLYRDLTSDDAQFVANLLKASDIKTMQNQALLIKSKVASLLSL